MRVGTHLGHIRLIFGIVHCGQNSCWLVKEDLVWRLEVNQCDKSKAERGLKLLIKENYWFDFFFFFFFLLLCLSYSVL